MADMTNNPPIPITMLGLGEMGRALAAALLSAGHPTTIWNRSPGKADQLVAAGARAATTIEEAVGASPVVIVCLYDHASVHDVLDPVADGLTGRTVINVTTTTPDQSRELAGWAGQRRIDYLDGGIMAVPAMIGKPGSLILYSGSAEVFERTESALRLWGESRFLGPDAGLAPLCDLAILTPMYTMFAGFLHGAAMAASAGVPARELAAMAAPFLTAVVPGVQEFAEIVDGGDYTVPGQQSLEFSDLSDLVAASEAAAVDPILINAVQTLIRRQIDAGHGKQGFTRIFESLRRS
jgi:3-hydroxyisobutyrate dehydrogenase-like beta-hydroxyacid dehydrogenase